MNLKKLHPRQALNKAYLKAKPTRLQIERFKDQLLTLLEHTNEHESEEHHKNLVSDFLKKVWYDPQYFINTKGRQDLVIHTGSKPDTAVGVIIEAKKPTNRSEMPTQGNINVKAFHELLYYYLQERITHENRELKQLIITNIHEWYIFDAHRFETCFAGNKKLVSGFTDFIQGRMSGHTTDFFYKQIAAPAIESLDQELPYTYIDIRDFEKPLRNQDPRDDHKLVVLFKLLSPEHLLKLPFANDSNSLDRKFYSELLHIIGLTETKEGGKKVIGRPNPEDRHPASLLENAIEHLDSHDKIGRLDKPSHYGANYDDQLYNVGLELSITWINRILFLKLLEAQLIAYHRRNRQYAFLQTATVTSYDDLDGLFFQILARRHEDRKGELAERFSQVPYLNSSLFEPTDLEHITINISNLKDELLLPLYSNTVLKDQQGRKLTGSMDAMQYLFRFLEAYDFSSEGGEDIQEENKSLINASVLGLIFEKINGYKDGSFFTPGFITMYMCRETIRKAVVHKFETAKGWSGLTFDQLYNKLEPEDIGQANEIINSLLICDPAVGSGHFLVSALNEIIAIKNDLRILTDRQGKRLKEYHVEVVNDELIITDEDGELFEYHPGNKEKQRVQEALFHEKQRLIENCLFGVDINPNSVKICRLRLWIELLKHAYYKNDRELETLPNIDINIKCGNSLVSRFSNDADLKQALRKSKWSIDTYRIAVSAYREAQSKEEKRKMEKLISDIKSEFQSEISVNDPLKKKLAKVRGDLTNLMTVTSLLEKTKKEKQDEEKKMRSLSMEVNALEAELEELRSSAVFENSLEWRFEFPEVLDDDGDFVGFDVVIGNPPYIRQEELVQYKPYFQRNFETYAGTADLYVYFVERGMSLLKPGGQFVYILPNKWMRAGYGSAMRSYLKHFAIQKILDFGDLPVFEEATTYPCIMHLVKGDPAGDFEAVNVATLDFPEGMDRYVSANTTKIAYADLLEEGWTLKDRKIQDLLAKIRSKGVPLSEYVDGKIYRGVLTGLNEAFVIDQETRDRLIAEDPRSAEIIKPFLAGRDIKRYKQPRSEKYLIFTRRGIDIDRYPAILQHLSQFRTQLEPRPKDYKGSEWSGRKPGSYKWYEIQDAVDYYEEFEKEKIIYPNILQKPEFTIDRFNQYANQKCFIITNFDNNLLGILNSQLTFFLFKHLLPKLRGDFYEPSYKYLKDFPIVKARSVTLTELVDKKLKVLEVETIDGEINDEVYQLYSLTKDEIKLIENQD